MKKNPVPKMLIVFVLLLSSVSIPFVPAGAQSGNLDATGTLTLPNNPTPVALTLSFPPVGGTVTGTLSGQRLVPNPPSTDCIETFTGDVKGDFTGGDGGTTSGTMRLDYSFACANGTNNQSYAGTWSGALFANGHGGGVWSSVAGSGTWDVTFSADAFKAAFPSPTPEATATLPATATATPTQTVTITPNPTLIAWLEQFNSSMPGYTQYLMDQIARLQNIDSPPDAMDTPVIVPWGDFRLARIVLDENGNPMAQDVEGVQVRIQPDGIPLGPTDDFSASLQTLLQKYYTEIDWLGTVEGLSEYTNGLIQNLNDPSLETVTGMPDAPQLSQEFHDLLKALSNPEIRANAMANPEIEQALRKLTPAEHQLLEANILALAANSPAPRYSLINPPNLDYAWKNFFRTGQLFFQEDLENMTSRVHSMLRRDDLDPKVREEMQTMVDFLVEEPAEDMYFVQEWSSKAYDLLTRQKSIDAKTHAERMQLYYQVHKEIGNSGLNELVKDERITPAQAEYFKRHIANGWPPETNEARQLIDAYNSMLAFRNQPKPPPEPSWFAELGLNFLDKVLRDRTETNTSIFIAEGY